MTNRETGTYGIQQSPRFYGNIRDIVKHVTETGSNFFSPDAMRFFNSRLTTQTYGYFGNVFITSEKLDSPYTPDEPRKYTVRAVDPYTGDIHDASKFQEFATVYEAKKFAKAYAARYDKRLGVN